MSTLAVFACFVIVVAIARFAEVVVEGLVAVFHTFVDMNSPQNGIKSPAALRGLGVVLVVLGGALMGGMAVLSWVMYGVIQNSSDPRATSRFTGSESDMMFMFAIFALVFFIGLTAFTAGLWQVIFGKRNIILVWIMLALGGVFFIVGMAVKYLN